MQGDWERKKPSRGLAGKGRKQSQNWGSFDVCREVVLFKGLAECGQLPGKFPSPQTLGSDIRKLVTVPEAPRVFPGLPFLARYLQGLSNYGLFFQTLLFLISKKPLETIICLFSHKTFVSSQCRTEAPHLCNTTTTTTPVPPSQFAGRETRWAYISDRRLPAGQGASLPRPCLGLQPVLLLCA